jgi:hypothetical protein
MQLCPTGIKKGYKMQDDDLEVSRQMSKQFRDERLAKEKGMLRLFTINEEEILRKGLKDGEVKEE